MKFYKRPPCHTLSKAPAKSRATMTVSRPSSRVSCQPLVTSMRRSEVDHPDLNPSCWSKRRWFLMRWQQTTHYTLSNIHSLCWSASLVLFLLCPFSVHSLYKFINIHSYQIFKLSQSIMFHSFKHPTVHSHCCCIHTKPLIHFHYFPGPIMKS